MKNERRSRVVGLFLAAAAVAAASSGCLADGATDTGEQTELQQSAVLGVDEFLYFRSNATGWGVDDSTRMGPFAGGAFSKLFSVTQDWMVAGGDTAIVTKTNQLNGWGTSQTFYGAAAQVNVPGTATLVQQAPGGDAHFKVKYAGLGGQRVIVALTATPPIIQIDSSASACAGVCPPGLTCSLLPNGIPTCNEPPRTGP